MNINDAGTYKSRGYSSYNLGLSFEPEDMAFAEAEEFYLDGRFEDAAYKYGRAAEISSKHLGGWLGRVFAQLAMDNVSQAEIYAEDAARQFSDHPRALSLYAYVLARRNKKEKALEKASEAYAMTKGKPSDEVKSTHACCLLLCKKHSEAQEVLNTITVGPKNVLTMVRLAEMLINAKKYEPAGEIAHKLTLLCPTRTRIWCLDAKAWMLAGDKWRARDSADKALEIDKNCEEAFRIKQRLGHSDSNSNSFFSKKSWLPESPEETMDSIFDLFHFFSRLLNYFSFGRWR